MKLLLLLAVCLQVNGALVIAYSERLPIGAIFDHSSQEMRAAFSYEIMNHNSEGTSNVKLDANSQKIQVNDSYSLSTTICSQMANGIVALFGTHSVITLPTLRSFTSTFHMPFVTPSLAVNVSGQELGFELYMRPMYAKALINVMKHYHWEKVHYIYSSEEGLIRLQQLFDAISADGIPLEVKVYRVLDADDAYRKLSHLEAISDEDKRVLLDLPTSECEKLLGLQATDARRVKLHYLLAGLGISELKLDAYQHGGINMTGFQLVNFHEQKVRQFFSSWQELDKDTWKGAGDSKISGSPPRKMKYEAALAVDAVRLISKALSKMLTSDPHVFQTTLRHGKFYNNGTEGIDCDSEPVIPWRHGYDIMKIMRESDFEGLSGRIAFDSHGLRRDYELEVLEVNLNRGLAKIGNWSPMKGLSIQNPSLVRSKGNEPIKNITRIVTSILTEPYLTMRQASSNGQPLHGNDMYEGYCADLAKKIADIVGYDYLIVPVKDGKYGSKDENGTWNGMVGELVRNTNPYLMKRSASDGIPLIGNDRFEGYCVDLAKKMAEIIGFSYIIRPVLDEKYGGMTDNGSWDGMIGELIREDAALAIAPLTITSVRERVIDFSKPFMSLGISIMIKKPTKEKPGVFSFMYPLSYEIWMCVIFAYIGVSVVLFLVSRFSPFEWHIEDNSDGPTVTNNFTIFNSLWFSLGAFMQQGCDIEPRSMSGRVVGSVWWFFTLIIISSYTANLAAFLTVERMQSPIESADDLAKQTEIKYGTLEGGSTMGFFRGSTIPVYERMWAFMSSAEPSVFVTSNEEGVKRVRESNGRYAFLTESTTNDYINQRKPCDTMKVGSNLDSKGYGIGTPLGSDLRDRVTLAVLELRENGELQKLETKWWYDKGECGKESSGKKVRKDTASALKLTNVAGIFYILVGGLVLALLMAVIEFLYKSKVEARRRKTSFSNAVKSKARLSIKGKPDTGQPPAVGSPDLAANMSMSTYTYAPAAQLISLDGYADGNTHTQV